MPKSTKEVLKVRQASVKNGRKGGEFTKKMIKYGRLYMAEHNLKS